MSFRILGLDQPYSPLDFLSILHDLADNDAHEKSPHTPTRSYVRDARAMASTPTDMKEYRNSYTFIIDMSGLKSGDIKMQVEDNVLVISDERKQKEEKERVASKYVRMKRRVGKFMRKFVLPENADTKAISVVCQDGVFDCHCPEIATIGAEEGQDH